MTEPLHEQFRLLGEKWANQEGEARGAEELRKVILSELVNHSAHTTLGKAEHEARASLRYKTHIQEMVKARTEANILKAQLNAMEMRFEMWRSSNATKRAEMRL